MRARSGTISGTGNAFQTGKPVLDVAGSSRTFRLVPLSSVARVSASTAVRSSTPDDELALSVLDKPSRRKGSQHYCSTCGQRYPSKEVFADFDDDGKRTGWTCDGCA